MDPLVADQDYKIHVFQQSSAVAQVSATSFLSLATWQHGSHSLVGPGGPGLTELDDCRRACRVR